MNWLGDDPDPDVVASVFGGALAGMSRVAVGGDAEGGRWEAWLDPHDPSRNAHLVEQPPRGYGGMVQLGTFGRADELGVSIGGSSTRDRSRVHRTVAAATAPDATRVVVDDGEGALELTDIGLHPDQRSRLFAGRAAGPNAALTVTAYREDGSTVAQRKFHAR